MFNLTEDPAKDENFAARPEMVETLGDKSPAEHLCHSTDRQASKIKPSRTPSKIALISLEW
ncbi:TPA: hypothetical protein DHW51_02525 [Candidatus Poribacteria bacterium]|nr:hypothetical protein [Candidatus Poribacteria bacterium]